MEDITLEISTQEVDIDEVPAQETPSSEEKKENVDMKKLTHELNNMSQMEDLYLTFSYDEQSEDIIHVSDKNSGEVIRTLSSETAVEFSIWMKDMLNKLVNEKG